MSATAIPAVTAGLKPELFTETGARARIRTLLVASLGVFVIAGLGFRVAGLGSEALSEDELNKLNAVAEYRALGLTAANAEHPWLPKALFTVSVLAAEKWNSTSLVSEHQQLQVSVETALRLPVAIFGGAVGVRSAGRRLQPDGERGHAAGFLPPARQHLLAA